MRNFFLAGIFSLCLVSYLHAAPCYGTKMPAKKKFFAGLQTHSIFKRYLENEQGKLRSTQGFLLLSYGVYDWLTIDLKGGSGNIRQHPADNDEIDYSSNFAGGYGFRIKLYDRKNIKSVFGFQHISVHPKSTHLGDVKHQAILDDWQVSLLVSYGFERLTPYVGAKCSRVDYIHWIAGSRKRVMSDLTKGMGLVLGLDIEATERLWLNLEGHFFNCEAAAISLNYKF